MNVEILEQNGHHFLWIDGYMWMWDLPFELEIQEDIAKQAFGDVLVVGHGLGIVQGFLDKNPAVKSIETVEKYNEVQTEYFSHFNKLIPGRVICNDFYFLPDPPYARWDCIIGDICPEIASKYVSEYTKFRNHAKTLLREKGKILCWGAEYYEYLMGMEGVKV